ncbi:Dna2-domain-containing protein [Boletus reticuloceps]|uniref:DNA replication ATP-dependent helicase/nuclease DNA2 n=1 Tax=Boletus reticuloceps TaxID=495285 RepID=A0A8I3AH09_9AGAM|nr:Dna2-domain-containing protein [Boletus reticuloceps]
MQDYINQSPTKHKSKENHADDLSLLLDGAENWDWADMEADFLTPKKKSASPTKRSPIKRQRSPVKPVTPRRACSMPSGNAPNLSLSALLEGAETWDWQDMESDFLSPARKRGKLKSGVALEQPYTKTPCARCIVEAVQEGQRRGSKLLSVKTLAHGHLRSVTLQDDWAESDVRKGDIINVLGHFDSEGAITISSRDNLFIHHPDLLLTATALSNAPHCRRKPLLSSLVRSTSDATPALVWGNMLHEIMQTCLATQQWDEFYVEDLIEDAVMKNLPEIIKIGTDIEEAKRELKLRSRGLKVFSERYIADTPKPDAILANTRAAANQNTLLAITSLHDIEEDIWSPTYGLKGKLDASVQTIIAENTFDKSVKQKPLLSTHTMPFEIKTGRSIAGMEHRAQTMLYTLLVEERYGVQVPSGLLYYTQSEEVNEMAAYMMRRVNQSKATEPFLPPTIDDERTCKRCYSLDACMLYRKASIAVENVVDDASPIAGIYDAKTSHLTPAQADFFKQWEALIALEEQDGIRFRKELWTMSAQKRAEKGRCFDSMVIDKTFFPSSLPSAGKIHRYTYRFIRGNDAPSQSQSLLNGHMNMGDAISISVEPELLALARGCIVDLTPQQVVVGVDHELNLDKIAARLQVLRNLERRIRPEFRIDRDEMSGMGRIRDNLAQLFYADGDTRRLGLVVDLRKPAFEDEQATVDALRDVPEYVAATSTLNSGQVSAMTRALSANDYALILGMPGTGKTTVIAALIRTFVATGKTVLLASYTHSAVDTILLKLKDDDYSILRLGNVDKVHPDVRQFTEAKKKTAKTIEQLENQLMSPPVVATTCLTIDHPLFSRRTFDYCIIDEASQITLPTCLGPLRFADKFVLVGDHFQLPPLVRNPAARKGGLDVSLFRKLSVAHPHAVVDLTHQYRMNEDIMLLSNKLIYSDRLRCGSESVAKQSLVLPDKTFIDTLCGAGGCLCSDGKCWLAQLLDENCKAVFVDTDRVPAIDSRVGDLVQNEVEGKIVYQIVEALSRSGIEERQIGIMSLYRQQIKLLSHLLQDRKQIEILTADKSQGRDKDCVIISMVRSNDHGQVGDLLKDWRRVNVSFTRARSKLVIIGSRRTLGVTALLAEFLELMEERGWVLVLGEGAERMHPMLEPPRMVVVGKQGGKREAEEVGNGNGAGADGGGVETPPKKARTPVRDGVLRGRPILQDVVNDGL